MDVAQARELGAEMVLDSLDKADTRQHQLSLLAMLARLLY